MSGEKGASTQGLAPENTFSRSLFLCALILAITLIPALLITYVMGGIHAHQLSYFDAPDERNLKVELIEKIIAISLVASALVAPFFVDRVYSKSLWASILWFSLFVFTFHLENSYISDKNLSKSAIGFLAAGAVLFGYFKARWPVQLSAVAYAPDRVRYHWADLVFVGLVVLIFLPVSIQDAAVGLNFDAHIVSFMLGPAIELQFGHGLVPGLDFHAHYGVGHPTLFSHFVVPDYQKTIRAYVVYFLVCVVLFYTTAYLIGLKYIDSRFWLVVAFLIAIVMSFQGQALLYPPSNWPLRYPLMIVVAALFAEAVAGRRRVGAALLLGLALTASIFFSTETGLYFSAAVGLLLLVWLRRPPLWTILVVGLTGIATFAVVCYALFGPRALTVEFAWKLIEPLTIYGGGFGSYEVKWSAGFGYLYAVAAQIVLAATLACLIYQNRRKEGAGGTSSAFVAILCLFGLFMEFKYYNRSLDALWFLNALPFFLVAAWWLERIQRYPRLQGVIRRIQGVDIKWAHAVGLAVLAFCVVLATTYQDYRNPAAYGLRGYIQCRTLWRSLFVSMPTQPWPEPVPYGPVPYAKDIALIEQAAPPGTRVALLHTWDWTHLIEAERASKFYFMPSVFGYWTDEQFFQSVDQLIVPARLLEGKPIEWLKDEKFNDLIRRELEQHFEPAARGEQLVLMRRKDSVGAR